MALAIFDLDHTLLHGDSDLLWVEFLVARGVLGPDFLARNAVMQAGYRSGEIDAADFCSFYAATLAGGDAAHWQALRADFLAEALRPRLGAAARALVQRHHEAGDELLLSTATNRYLAEPSAAELGFAQMLATELERDAQGRYTGRLQGPPNMRAGKLVRLRDWLLAQGRVPDRELAAACFYSDSINDLPLLAAVGRAIAVDPDTRLAAEAATRGWPVLRLSA